MFVPLCLFSKEKFPIRGRRTTELFSLWCAPRNAKAWISPSKCIVQGACDRSWMGLIIFELNHPQHISVIPWGFFHLGLTSSDSFWLHSQGSIHLPPKIRVSYSSLPERMLRCAFINVEDLLVLMLICGKNRLYSGGKGKEIRVSAHLVSSVQQIVGSQRRLGKD